MKLFARIISIIFHPIIFSLLLPFTVIFRRSHNLAYSLKWMVFSSGFLILTMFIYFLFRPKEFFTDFDISHREKRTLFYFLGGISTLLYFLTVVLLKGIFFPLSVVALGVVISCVIFEIANRYLKVSIHSAMVTAYIVTLGILYGWKVLLLTIWVIPLLAWSRIYLKKHTLIEVIVGILLGELVTGLTFGFTLLLH